MTSPKKLESSANDYSSIGKKREAPAPKEQNMRGVVLSTADNLVNGDRNVQYGDPTADFKRTGEFWNTYLLGVLERKLGGKEIDPLVHQALSTLIESWDVAAMMQLLKLSRLTWTPQKLDHWVDAAGYAACGADCVNSTMGEMS